MLDLGMTDIVKSLLLLTLWGANMYLIILMCIHFNWESVDRSLPYISNMLSGSICDILSIQETCTHVA